jgi:uroporphyrinogen-III synthase
MRIIVTRPQSDATTLQQKLEALSHEVVSEPLLKLSFDKAEPIDLDDVQALIATSRNGLRALEHQRRLESALQIPIFAVGPGTAGLARSLGFEFIIAGKGTGRDLLTEIMGHLDPHAGHIVHLAGDTLAFDLAGEAAQHGFRIVSPVVYQMAPAKRFSAPGAYDIASGEADAVMLLSPRTADVWVALVTSQGLADQARRMLHLCLSPAVARRLAPLGAIRIETAAAPNLDEMLALII